MEDELTLSCSPDPPLSGYEGANLQEADCKGGEEFCLKLWLEDELTLSCSPDPPLSGYEGCKEEGGTVNCHCSSDLCNSSNSLSFFLPLPLLLLLLLLPRPLAQLI